MCLCVRYACIHAYDDVYVHVHVHVHVGIVCACA